MTSKSVLRCPLRARIGELQVSQILPPISGHKVSRDLTISYILEILLFTNIIGEDKNGAVCIRREYCAGQWLFSNRGQVGKNIAQLNTYVFVVVFILKNRRTGPNGTPIHCTVKLFVKMFY